MKVIQKFHMQALIQMSIHKLNPTNRFCCKRRGRESKFVFSKNKKVLIVIIPVLYDIIILWELSRYNSIKFDLFVRTKVETLCRDVDVFIYETGI